MRIGFDGILQNTFSGESQEFSHILEHTTLRLAQTRANYLNATSTSANLSRCVTNQTGHNLDWSGVKTVGVICCRVQLSIQSSVGFLQHAAGRRDSATNQTQSTHEENNEYFG